jgi:hypothetical protein
MLYVEGDGYKATQMYGEPSVFYDAVGDLTKIDAKWGPSVGAPQIRTLRDPLSGNAADRWRVAAKLHDDPVYQADASWVISAGGSRLDLWTSYRSGAYEQHMVPGGDYRLVPGHPDAGKWNA